MLRFPHKQIRARVIADYIHGANYSGCVCFSCGNASKALKDEGLYVVDISPVGELTANKWWNPDEIHKAFPDLFDGTSGHLPLFLMSRIADAYKSYLDYKALGLESFGLTKDEYEVPSGSGESLVCLKLAYPDKKFRAVYNLDASTQYCESAPLNDLVRLLASSVQM